MTEISFDVHEDELAGGYTASAVALGIHTEADSLHELRANVLEAVDCYFDEGADSPTLIRLRFTREEVLSR